MATLAIQFHLTRSRNYPNAIPIAGLNISCSMQPAQRNIKVVINGAAKEIGRAAVKAVTKARGMEVSGAVDSHFVGEDIGKLCDMEEVLEIPILNDLTMVLGSISQSKEVAVVVDFTDPSTVYDNVKQATAFGMKSVVYVPRIKPDTVMALSSFCDKASMGCIIAPTLSIGSILLQQAAITASFHYRNVEIVESKANTTLIGQNVSESVNTYLWPANSTKIYILWGQRTQFVSPSLKDPFRAGSSADFPSPDAIQIANNLSNIGQLYNKEDLSTDAPARGQRVGEDGVRVHSLVLPGLPSSTTVYFSGQGEVYTLKHDITDVHCLMPGLIMAIRKVVRLKNLVYGLEKFL